MGQTLNASERSREMEGCSCRNEGECSECLFQHSTMLLALLRSAEKSDTGASNRRAAPEKCSGEPELFRVVVRFRKMKKR